MVNVAGDIALRCPLATDPVFNRICKAISFGVMTGFAICGAIYDTSNVGENVKAFRALALILMVSRLALVVQYGVVSFYVRSYRKTLAPMLSTMGTLFLSVMVFLGTFWGYDLKNTGDSFPNQEGDPRPTLHTTSLSVWKPLLSLPSPAFGELSVSNERTWCN